MQHKLGVLSVTAALVLLLLLLGADVGDGIGYGGYGARGFGHDGMQDKDCFDEFKSCSTWAKKGLCCEQFYFDRCQLSCSTCGPGPQACNISGRIYPSGTKFQKNCMSFHCEAGELYTENKYNPECGSCLIQNDPHFLSYHNKKFDWHGNEMYTLSQRGNDICPEEYVNAQFSDCIKGLPWATCLDTIYFQPQPDTSISVVKSQNIQNSLVTVNGVTNTITAQEDGKLHILDGAVDSEFPVLAWLNDDCLHFMGSKENGFLIKLCSWSLKIFAYPELSKNLGGLCGNWDKDSMSYSEGSLNVWEEETCADVGVELSWTTTDVTLDACKDMCDDSAAELMEPCNAILYKPNHCMLLRCPLPVPVPTVSNLEYLGYVKGGVDQLRTRDGGVVIPPKTDKLFLNWANMIIDEAFGHDWQVSCDRTATPAVIDPNPCSLDEIALGEINQICEAAVDEIVTEGLSAMKIAAIKADCSFDRCLAIKAENETLAEEWLEEVKIQCQREEMEIKNTVEIIHDPCFVGSNEYSSGTKWEDNCMSFYCEKGIFYTTNKYNSHCTTCTAKNDPHFETFDGVIYDWHGQSTYIISQEGPADCPDTFISSSFQPCAVGAPGATCLHTVYIQFTKNVFIEVKVENNMLDAEIIVDGMAKNIATETENAIQILHDNFEDEDGAVFGWMNGDCLHVIGFKKRGYLIKICKWSVKVYAHPSTSNKLYGLCGDNNGETSHDLKLRNGESINPPGNCLFCFASMNVDPNFGRDWEIKDCEVIANFTAGPIVDPVNLCDADEATLEGYFTKCEETLEFGDHLAKTVKDKILADCAFDQCISAGADDGEIANQWLTECQVIVTTQEEEIVNTVIVPLICDPPCANDGVCIGATNMCMCKPGFTGVQCQDRDPDSCSLGGKLYKSGVEWQENCMMFSCKEGKFYTSEKFNANCGVCQVNNDPHFVTYDGATYDWHGHSTYILSQRGDELCPEVAVSGKFKECGIMFPFATCVDTIYYQLDIETNIKIMKHTAIFGKVSYTVHVNEFANILNEDVDEGEMQPLRDEEKEYPVFAWNYDNCIQIMGFQSKGFMIKLCSWSFKIYAHPHLSSNLFGLCGDFNADQNGDLKMRDGAIISPPTGWPNKNVDAGFGDDWQVQKCVGGDGVRTPPGMGNGQNEAVPCEADDDTLEGYKNDCQEIIDKGRALLTEAAKQRFIDGCVFDRCLAFRLADITDDTKIVGNWMNELQILFEQEEEEMANTVEYPLGSGKCPGGYTEIASQCLSINTESLINWEDARIQCEAKSGRLAVIQKGEELQLFLNENHKGRRFWVGASDLITEGVWLWMSGDTVAGRPKFPWGPWEPNNLFFNEHCLEYNGQLNFYNDAACSDALNFICEANTVSQEKGSCVIDEKTYPNGKKWEDGCMTYYCKDGSFYTDNKYHGECGSCSAKNDPHFTTFDGTTYDWHGHSTYVVAQEGSSECPEIFVHGHFSACAVGLPGATCLHTIHLQPVKNTKITIIMRNNIEDSEIYVDDYLQQINVMEEGKLQVIKGPNSKLKPAFMWISDGCLHVMAFDRKGLMIKLCDWSLKVFAHPVAANKLHGLCGDWNGNRAGDLKMRNGAIINPPGGFWFSKNVDAAFGNDWEIAGTCTETANVELPTDPHTDTAGCDVTEDEQAQFYETCKTKLEVADDILDGNKLIQLIESCAFDLCIAHQTGNESIADIWLNTIHLNAQHEKEEMANTIKAKVPGSCYLDGTEYPQGSEWVENCMMYYCKGGKFYSSNSYNGDCGSCDANNDPHFKTFDGVTYDWHGHSTYVVSQHGSEDCPDTYVNSEFTRCTSGLPHATCVHIVYIQPLKGTLIKVVKHSQITHSEVHIDGYSQKVSVTGDGEMQILRGPDDEEKHAFAWFFNDCLHIQGFKVQGYLVKICHWSMKVFAHPALANNLYGLCGDWNRDKVGDLKLRDGVTIIAPPAGGWWSKNVNIAFGEDWEIKTCTENTDITIGGEAITENPCEASEEEQTDHHDICLAKLTPANNGLDENKLQLLIEDCAFDRCIAFQSDNETLIEEWINAALGILEEEVLEMTNTGLGSGSCYIGGVGYPSGREWQENCMRYYCEEGHFYSRKVYNSECGHCTSRNDPHFITYDSVKFDWHGQSTYVISQQSSKDCPTAFVNSKFKNCAFGVPGATCLDMVYYKTMNSPILKIMKDEWNVQNSQIEIDGNIQQLSTNNDGELQILKGLNNKEYPLFGLIHDGCVHIIGFDDTGFLIKLCKWDLTVYSHPALKDDLFGLCGDWDNSAKGDLKLRNGEIISAPSSGGGGFFGFFKVVNKNVDKRYGNDWEVKECPTLIIDPNETEEVPENSCDASEDDLKEYKKACDDEVMKKKIFLDEETLNDIIEDCIFDRCIAKKSDNETLEEEWIGNCGGIVDQKEKEKENTIEPGSCFMNGQIFPTGTEWTDNCMTYYCEQGIFHSSNKYNGECGSCSVANDPHFTSFDGLNFDWHGKSTYVISQQSGELCPDVFVNSQFGECTGNPHPGATCLDTIYFQPAVDTLIKIVKDVRHILNSKIYVNGHLQKIFVKNNGELQILKGANNAKLPAFGWINNDCIYFTGFDISGYMIKICHKAMKIYVHPSQKNKLYGLCGDWNNNKDGDLKLRNGNKITAPGGANFADWQVNPEFGKDWEIQLDCSTNVDNVINEVELEGNACTASEEKQQEYLKACSHKLKPLQKGLDEEKLNRIIEECAFDRCIAIQTGKEGLPEEWLTECGTRVEEEEEEITNTVQRGSCYINGKAYMNKQEWEDGCISYYCKDGKFHTHNKYNRDCGHCTSKNDPHFTTYDGTTYDWHGHNTYVLSQNGNEACPDDYVNSKLKKCTSGNAGATCTGEIYFQVKIQPNEKYEIKIVKAVWPNPLKSSEVYINGYKQVIAVKPQGELQVLKGPHNREVPVFGWHYGNCIHIIGFNTEGFMIKLCDWYVTVYAHPSLASNLYGLCGDWDGKKSGDLKKRDQSIINPPGGWWASKNVKEEFGIDWEINADCPSAYRIIVDELVNAQNPCDAPEKDLERYYEECRHKIEGKGSKLAKEVLTPLIEDCAFDLCIAGETGDKAKWLGRWGDLVLQIDEEADNTAGGTCKDGFEKIGIQCFYFGNDVNDERELSWTDAFHRCQEKGGQLAVIKEPEVFSDYLVKKYGASGCVFPFIYEGISYDACTTVKNGGKLWCSTQVTASNQYINGKWKNCKGSRYDFWLGASDIAVEGQFRWIDGSQIKEGFKWNRGEPNNDKGAEDCVHMFTGGLHNDEGCHGKRHFVCDDTKGQLTLPEPASFSTVKRIADEFISWKSGGGNGGFLGIGCFFGGCGSKTYNQDYILFTAEGNHEANKQLVYIEKARYTSDPEPLKFNLCDLHQGAYDLGDDRRGLVYILPGDGPLPKLELFEIWHKTDETLTSASLSRNDAQETPSIKSPNFNKIHC